VIAGFQPSTVLVVQRSHQVQFRLVEVYARGGGGDCHLNHTNSILKPLDGVVEKTTTTRFLGAFKLMESNRDQLVVSTQLKKISQNWNLPQIGVKIRNN